MIGLMLLSLYCRPLIAHASSTPNLDEAINNHFAGYTPITSKSIDYKIRNQSIYFDYSLSQYQAYNFDYTFRLTEMGYVHIPYRPTSMGLVLSISTSVPATVQVAAGFDGYIAHPKVEILYDYNGKLLPFPAFSGSGAVYWDVVPYDWYGHIYMRISGTYVSSFSRDVDHFDIDIAAGFTLYFQHVGALVSPPEYITATLLRGLGSDIISAISGGATPPSYTDTSISDATGQLESADQSLSSGVSNLDKFASTAADYDFSWISSSLDIFVAGINVIKPLFGALVSPPVVSAILSVTFIFVLFLMFLRRL